MGTDQGEFAHQLVLAGVNRKWAERAVAAHDAETVRVTAEKAAQIALVERNKLVQANAPGAYAANAIATRIRATFNLAPNEDCRHTDTTPVVS